jgi:hypothetical protein
MHNDFRCLTVSIRPLRVEELAEILAIQFDRAEIPTFNPAWRPVNAEEAVMSACSSLIAVVDRQGSQIVQFLRQGVLDIRATCDSRRTPFILSRSPRTSAYRPCTC